jgi:hypothetical protein
MEFTNGARGKYMEDELWILLTDAASDWLIKKRHCIGKKGLPGVQLQN